MNEGLFWHAILDGEPVSKANSRRAVGRGRIIKSEKALNWATYVRQQLATMRPRQKPLDGPVYVWARLYYRSERPDLDESLLLDLLQGYAYKNDRQVRQKFVTHAIDKARPRCEVRIWPLPPRPEWVEKH